MSAGALQFVHACITPVAQSPLSFPPRAYANEPHFKDILGAACPRTLPSCAGAAIGGHEVGGGSGGM